MHRRNLPSVAAFTLLELSVVILILGLFASAVLRYTLVQSESTSVKALNASLDVVEAALMNYRIVYNRLPCPAAINSQENAATFGTEVGTSGDGSCTGADFINSVTGNDPDGAQPYAAGITGDSYKPSADPLYDSVTMSQVVAGAIPTKTLKLADKYAYDSWGRKILYIVDKRATATNAFVAYSIYTSNGPGNIVATTTPVSIGAIVVKKTATDTLANALTYKAIYALVSFGPDGHGGYMRNPSATSVIYNSGATNADELNNCHCTSIATTSTTFNRIFVQKPKTPSATLGSSFGDIVRFKTRQQMGVTSDLQ